MRRPLLARLLGLTIAPPYRDEVIDDLIAQRDAERANGGGTPRPGAFGRLAISLRFHARLLRSGWDSRVYSGAPAVDAADRGHGVTHMPGSIVRDIRFAGRALARTPWFSAAAIATLALGLGAALTVAAVANSILRAPVPWSSPDRLVMLSSSASARWGVTFQEHEAVKETSSSLEMLTPWQGWSATLTDPAGLTAQVAAASVGGQFFPLLGVAPALGRAIEPADDQIGRPPVVVLNHGAWQRFFGGDPDVIGRRLDIDGAPYTIVGVMPAGFIDPINWAIFNNRATNAWRSAPDLFQRGRETEGWVGFWSVGRLREDATVEAAAAEVQVIRSRLAPPGVAAQTGEAAVRLRDANTRAVRAPVFALFAAVIALLLIVCVNVANLLLGRAIGRRGETALRLALGASRGAVIRHVLAESALLASVGAALGLGLAVAGVRAVRAIAGPFALAGLDVAVDAVVAIAAGVLAVVTAVLFGIVPAWRASRTESMDAMRESGRGQDMSTSGRYLRRLLVVAETAMACALLVQAGLLGRSLMNLLRVDPGFESHEALAVGLTLTTLPLDRVAEQTSVLDAVFVEIARLQGVTAVGSISDFPMSGAINSTIVRVPGRTDSPPFVLVRTVAGDYFNALLVPLLQGRSFGDADRQGAAPVALVNEAFVTSVFGTADPIGRRVLVRGIEREIVGVVRSVSEFRPGASGDLTLYTPFAQEAEPWMRAGATLVVRGDVGDALSLAAPVREAIARAAPGRPSGMPRSAASYVDRHLAVPRLQAVVIGTFAVTAIVLAAIGLGGVLACAVAERGREIAVRLAMGARPSDVARMIVGQSMALTLVGLVIGVAAGSMLSNLVAGSLYGVEAGDVSVTLAAVVVLISAALGASWVPARRASLVNPIEALRG